MSDSPDVPPEGASNPFDDPSRLAMQQPASRGLANARNNHAARSRIDLHKLEARFRQLCQIDLQLDDAITQDVFQIFHKTKQLLVASVSALGSGTEEEMGKWWIACILYYVTRLKRYPHGTGAVAHSLSKLLKVMNISIWNFFRELAHFLIEAECALRSMYGDAFDAVRQQAKGVQANFVHLTVLYNYYKRNFFEFFLPIQKSQATYGMPMDFNHLRFGWMLFLALRMEQPGHFVDLVTCTNGLIAVLVIMLVNMPANLWKVSVDDTKIFAVRNGNGVGILSSLCQYYEASENDVKAMVERANCIIQGIVGPTVKDGVLSNQSEHIRGFNIDGLPYFNGLMEETTLNSCLDVLDKNYEDFYQKQGEIDERMFLPEDRVSNDLPDNLTVTDESTQVACGKRKRDVISSPAKPVALKLVFSSDSGPSPSPVKVINNKMPPPTPVSVTMTTAKWLRTIVSPLPAEPSADLKTFLRSCDTDITNEVTQRAENLLKAIFSGEGVRNSVPQEVKELVFPENLWPTQRMLEALKLYYRVLCAMCKAECKRLHSNNLSALLTNERFHRCMLACSAEVVLATHKTVSMPFPSVLGPTGITAFDLSKVVESFVRHEETLPRELKRHLNSIEEKMLEQLAWEKGSSLYSSLIVARPHLRREIYQLGLLWDQKVVLEGTRLANQQLSGRMVLKPKSGSVSDGTNGALSPPRSNTISPTKESDASLDSPTTTASISSIFLSPIRERPSAFSVFTPTKSSSLQPPLQSAFASPQRPSPAGGGETCAETVICVFFQKVLKLAAIRIRALCESLQQPIDLMEDVYKMVQNILQQETQLFFNRHIDQIILCSLYGVSKVKQLNLTFKEIVQHYKQNPQHKAHVFRTVLLGFTAASPSGREQDTGDIIRFYNEIFVPKTKALLLQLSTQLTVGNGSLEDDRKNEGSHACSPGPSPFPSLPDASPKKVSASHNVYVSPLKPSKIMSPHSRSLYACFGESTHAYQSPSKDLTEINKRLNNSRRVGKLDFGTVGLVSDSLVAGTLFPRHAS